MTKTQLTNLSSLVELFVVTLFLLSRLPYNRTHLNTSLLSHTMDRVSFAQTLTRFLSNTAIIKTSRKEEGNGCLGLIRQLFKVLS